MKNRTIVVLLLLYAASWLIFIGKWGVFGFFPHMLIYPMVLYVMKVIELTVKLLLIIIRNFWFRGR